MKNLYIIVLMVLGFILTPETSFACNNSNHTPQNKSYTECSVTDTNHAGVCKQEHKGKCDGNSCQCLTIGMLKFLPIASLETGQLFNSALETKEKFVYSESYFESDTYGLRLPPKIS